MSATRSPRLSRWLVSVGAALALVAVGVVSTAAATQSVDPKTRAALTVLKQECFACHGEQKQKGGLSLLSRDAVLKGGDDGPVIQPGKPKDSKLLGLLQPGVDSHMPPRKQLDPAQVRILSEWIKAGAGWDAATLSEEEPVIPVALQPLPESYHPTLALSLSPDGKRLAAGHGGQLALYDLTHTNLSFLKVVHAHLDAVQSLAWTPDGTHIVSGGFRRLRWWSGDALTAEREETNGLSGRITALAFTPDGNLLAAADGGSGRPGWIRFFGAPGIPVPSSWKAHADSVFSLEFNRDGTRLLSAGGDQLVRIWDPKKHQELAALEGHTAQVLAAAFNTNATQVLSGGADRQLKVWDIATREKIIALGSHGAGISAVAWPMNADAVYAATDDGGVFRYTHLKAHTGEQSSASGDEQRIATLGSPVHRLVVTPDGSRLIAGCQDGSLHLWDAAGKLLGTAVPPPTADSSPVAVATIRPSRTASAKPALPTATTVTHTPAPRIPTGAVTSLTAEPASLELGVEADRRQLVITATMADGFEWDATEAAHFSLVRGTPIRLGDAGDVRATGPGAGSISVRVGSRELKIPVTVRSNTPWSAPQPSFVRDVLPVLNQVGCSAGSCHAKPDGQNGFKLTVFSFDPRADYAEIVNEAHGRRAFPAAPNESLLLQKALGRIAHEGGRRFEAGSEPHELLVRWIRSGMPYAATNEPVLQRISVFPRERRYHKGAVQRLQTLAHYSDGSVRDVTRLAGYESNDKELARTEEPGRVVIGKLTGQGVVVARYMGYVADSKILVPADTLLPAERYAGLKTNNFIDGFAYAQFQRLGLMPSDSCTDLEFLRRAKLDTLGLLPTADDVRTFERDPAPDKRRRLIDRLLADPAYADFWANKWADLLRPNPDRVGVKSVYLLDQWIRDRFRTNQHYDAFVREILLTEGSNQRVGPAVIYRDRREPAELTTMFSQLFLGTRLECAKCHHHPNEKWSQDDFYKLAAYFGPLKQKGAGLSPPISAGVETFYFAPGGSVKHPVSGAVMTPRPPDGPEWNATPNAATADPRGHLADWLTATNNPFFARAAVNRVWGAFFGRGLVHPVDDFRSSNPCVNPALLDALATDFAAHGYDLKHLIRTLLESQLYQLSSTPNASNLTDTRNFSRAYRRRLPAEVMVDAVSDATGVAESFTAIPAGGRAVQAWSYKIQSHFMDAFGRPNSSSDCPCERDTQLSVAQSLHLMNSRPLQAKLSAVDGRLHRLASSTKAADVLVDEIYLITVNRHPTDAELATAVSTFIGPDITRQSACEDLFWALLNSPEFMLNH